MKSKNSNESGASQPLTKGIGSRIAECAELVGGKRRLAAEAGISEAQLYRYIAEESLPPIDVVMRIAAVADKELVWLAGGEARPYLYKEKNQEELTIREPGPNDYSYIRLYNVSATAGGGAIVASEDITDTLAFKREWLQHNIGASSKDLALIHVEGESMEPTLRPGDIILIDRRDTIAAREGIYVLRMDDALLVKRLQRLPGGNIKAISDNAAYSAFDLDQNEIKNNGIAIIGRVVWAGRRM